MRYFHFLIFFIYIQIATAQFPNATDPKLKIDFWIKHYAQVTHGPEYDLAHSVFERIINVADKPIGILPALYVFSDIRFNQLFATQDGGIVVPLKVIEYCQTNCSKDEAEARLAFLLGHEIKHIVRGDYELIKTLILFIEDVKDQNPTKDFNTIWDRINWGPSLERRKAMEIQADEYGILYASLAGFDIDAVLSPKNDFFASYYQFANLNPLGNLTHPSAERRSRAASQRIASIVKYLDLFHLGVKLYAIKEYDAAIELFTKFCTQYPSREVFNNRGLCYYKKALLLYAKWKPEETDTNPNFVYKLSTRIDPVSHASRIVRRVETKHEHSFLEAINRAVSDLKEAERLDPQYAIVRNNLGCVHLLKGELEFAKAYFKKAIEFNPSCKEAFNNLGICHIVEGNDEMARNCFLDANRIDSTYTDPYYNLAQQATRLGKAGEAKCFFKQFLNYDGDSPYSQKVKKYLGHPPAMHHPPFFSETIGGLQPMGLSPYGDQWENIQTQASQISLFHDKENQIGCCYYRNRQTSKTICLVWTDQNYPGQTSKSIAVNDTVASVYCHYPFARNEIHTSLENFVHYPDLNLVFELQSGKVRGWFLYELM